MRLLGAALFIFLFALTACSSNPEAGSFQTSCQPGRAMACTGPGGCPGGQTCLTDGSAFGECVCDDRRTEDAGLSDGGSADGAIFTDSAVEQDGASDVKCTPVVCTGNMCGTNPDGCGGSIECTPCVGPCVPKTCQQLGATCGTPSDGCGKLLNCGPTSVCDDGNDCTVDACTVTGKCEHVTQSDGAACWGGASSGVCRAGSCCTGCWNGSSCQAGNTLAACGYAGGLCASCNDNNDCSQDSCNSGACNNVFGPKDGQACSSGGVCLGNTCAECGGIGQFCCAGRTCSGGAGVTCYSGGLGVCLACGGLGQPCCAGNSCSSSTSVCSGSTCQQCGAKGQLCCAGSTCGTNMECSANKCVCGGYGQVPCVNNPFTGCDPGLIECAGPGPLTGKCSYATCK